VIPLTVIGGYLGAGKTTLINSLLSAGHGRRLAVLVNDFGAVNIDRDLIVRHDGDTIALSNGCVCCSITDALGTALDKVIALGPDNIVIEASGVADPAKIAYYGQGWPGVQLDAVAVLVDAASIRNRAGDKFVGELVQRQLDAGDILLLSKTDLISRQELRGVRGWLAARTLKSPMVELRHGSAPADLLLETGMLSILSKLIVGRWGFPLDRVRRWARNNFGTAAYHPERRYMRGKRDIPSQE
jgi:G3E family GTPase